MEHVILHFIDHTCEHTPWEDLEECKAYVSDEYGSAAQQPRIYPVILHFIDHTCEHTPWEDLEECKAYVSDEYGSAAQQPRIYPVHFIKVNDPDVGEIFFRLGEVNRDDWCVHRKGTM